MSRQLRLNLEAWLDRENLHYLKLWGDTHVRATPKI